MTYLEEVEFVKEPRPHKNRTKLRAQILNAVNTVRRCRQDRNDQYKSNRVAKNTRRLRRLIADRNGVFCKDQWDIWLSFVHYRCMCCKAEGVTLEKDHIIPLCKPQSSNHVSNMQLLCWSCNAKKGRNEIDFRPDWLKEIFA